MINLVMRPLREVEIKDLETSILASSFSDIFEDFFEMIYLEAEEDLAEGHPTEVMI